MNDLADLLEEIGRGRHVPTAGAISLLPGPRGTALAAVLGFTAHHAIAADLDPEWLLSRLGPTTDGADIGRPLHSDFLVAIGAHLHARVGGQDVLLVAEGNPLCGSTEARRANPADLQNPRVDRAFRYRDDVRVSTVHGGLVTVGRGLAGRWETSIEVQPARRGTGIGRALAGHGRTLVPAGALLWAQVHPANVSSLRAFLAAGFRPVGAEVLFTRVTPAAL